MKILISAIAIIVSLIVPARSQTADWGSAVVSSAMARNPNPDLLSWDYATALYLIGQYRVYQRTRDPKLLAYLLTWADRHVDSAGNAYFFGPYSKPVVPERVLNFYLAGRLMLVLYDETGIAKYKLAADRLAASWPRLARTSDRGFWIANPQRPDQIWLDGSYMILPFMIEYQTRFALPSIGLEPARQLRIIASHLRNPANGLLYHGYDEAGVQSWARNPARRSSEFWLRGVGWYAMALVDVLDRLPLSSTHRPALLGILNDLAAAMERYQDPATGRWFQVVDKGSAPGNWLETSGSAMFAYTLSRGVRRGWLPARYQAVADRGYQGVMAVTTIGSDGLTSIADICTGAVPTNLAGYFARPRAANDWHGLGAFLLMWTEFN